MRDKQVVRQKRLSQKGNVTLVTTILVVAMLLLSGGIARLTKLQYNLSQVHNNTSNHYYLAEAGAEMFIDSINELMSSANSQITKELQELIRDKMFIQDKNSKEMVLSERYVGFDVEEGFFINKHWITLQYINKMYQVLLGEYFDKQGTKPYEIYQAKPIIYSLKGERESQDQMTYIKIVPYINGGGNRLPSSLKDKEVIDYSYLRSIETLGAYTEEGIKKEYEKILFRKDTKKYKAAMGITVSVYTKNDKGEDYGKEELAATISFDGLKDVDYKILEKYEWVGKTAELLDGGLTCFEDIIVENEGKLQVEGDIRSLGSIGVDGGRLEVRRKDSSIESQGEYKGNIYSIGEVLASGENHKSSYISVMGNVVAEEVKIVNPMKQQIARQSIEIGGNLFVEGSVGIDEGVEESTIQMEGVIIGLSDTDLVSTGEKDPSKSSSIFNMGEEDSLVSMKGAYVAGQPFVDYEDGTGYHRLYESIGEPYRQLQNYPEYTEMNGFTDRYILEEEEFIRKDKIVIADSRAIYTPAYVSARVEGELVTNKYMHPLFQNQEQALKIFYKGEGDTALSEITNREEERSYDYIVLNPEAYYSGDEKLVGKAGMYHRDYGEPPKMRYKGIEAYMTAVRGVFLGRFISEERGDKTPKVLRLQDWIDYKKIEELEEVIEGNSSIQIINAHKIANNWQEVDISQFEQGEEDNPVLFIAKGPIKLTTSQPSSNQLRGIILALGDVKVASEVVLEGSMIINGSLFLENETSKLYITHDPKILMQIPFKNKKIERQVLDLLGLIHLEYTEIKELFKPSRDKEEGFIYYTVPQVKVTNQFDLVVENAPLQMKINALKSERK